jgi:hypothetical protein
MDDKRYTYSETDVADVLLGISDELGQGPSVPENEESSPTEDQADAAPETSEDEPTTDEVSEPEQEAEEQPVEDAASESEVPEPELDNQADGDDGQEDDRTAGAQLSQPIEEEESRPQTKSEKRYSSINDRIRNALALASSLEEDNKKYFTKLYDDLVPDDKIRQQLEKSIDVQKLEIYDIKDMVPRTNPYTGAEEGGMIDPNTNEPFTKEAAEYFLEQRQALNKTKDAEFQQKLDSAYKDFLRDKDVLTENWARRSRDDYIKTQEILADYPELDPELPDAPPEIKQLANAFWKEILDDFSEEVIKGVKLTKSDQDIKDLAQAYYESNRDYINEAYKNLASSRTADAKVKLAKAKARQKDSRLAKGIAPSAGSKSAAPKTKNADLDDFDAQVADALSASLGL